MHNHTTQAALTQLAQQPSMTGVPFTLVDLPGPVARERTARARKPNRRPAVPALALLGLAGYLTARKAGGR